MKEIPRACPCSQKSTNNRNAVFFIIFLFWRRFTVYVVELEYYKHNEFEILIPKLFGTELKRYAVCLGAGLI